MKNIIKKSIQNSLLTNQIPLLLGQAILFFCLVLASSTALQAQVVLQDFSTLNNASNVAVYGGFGGGQTATNALVDDPAPFTTNTVREVTNSATGDVWKGVFFRPQTNYIDLTVTKTVSLKVYATTQSYFKGKIQVGQSGQADIGLATSEAHTGSGWETLTFTFPTATGEWGEMVVFTNVDASGGFIDPPSALTAYFDDLTAVQGSALPGLPTDSPSTPPQRQAQDVISIFSGAYTDITVTNYNPNWGQSGYGSANTSYDPGDGNILLAYPNFNYQGIDFIANTQDASSMEYLHIDLWTPADPNATTIQVTPINSGTGTGEVLTTITYTTETWTSVDIPIGDFTGMTWDAVQEMKFIANGVGSVYPVDIYLDNIYFWKEPAAAGTDATLSDLQVDSATISGFSAATTSYTYNLLEGTTDIPQITAATTTDANAQTTITQATTIPGDATVVVTAQDGTTTQTYTVSYAYVPSPEGTWKFTPTAGAFMIGPSQGDGGYFTSSAADVTTRSCLFDDEYVFNADGSFENVLGSDTWLETWQAGVPAEVCGTPIAPHDGTNPATWSFSAYPSSAITIVGEGAYIGLAKVTNTNELGDPVDDTITYTVTSITSTNMTLDIQLANGNWWRFLFTKQAAAGSDCSGTTTTWNGVGWSNGVPDANSYAIISSDYSTGTNGNVTACYLQADADVTIDGATDTAVSEILVTAGNTLTVDGTSSLTVTGDFTNSGTVTLNSTSDDFSSLIVSGAVTGDITYNRFVNSYNDGFGGGWDLVGSPTVMTIADFITANGANIEVLGSDYAFSQYDNAIGDWIRYETASQTGSFTTGQGYSMATNAGDGATVAFTGAMQTADQSIDIINNNGVNGVGRRWNLVSNPFPSYIDGSAFLTANATIISDVYTGVYGWDGSDYVIYNQLDFNSNVSIAPGQGFWVAAASTVSAQLGFTADLRTVSGSGDFVTGPQLLTYSVGLKLYNGESQQAATKFYFRDGLSLDLDPGYDAGAFNQSTKLSTRLPQGTQETAFARNAMGMDAMQNTRVPLEIRQNAGQAFRVSIADMELPEDIYVYLEDTLNGTLTSLKDGDFELVAQSNLSGVDRFFIVFKSNSVLSNGDTLGINALNVYKANTDSFVTIAGISPELGKLNVSLYNILGQTVREKALNAATATQTISTDGLASGLYMVQIKSGNQTTVKKVIVK